MEFQPNLDPAKQHKEEFQAEEDAAPDVRWVDWEGKDDPQNPFNWSTKRKWLISSVGCINLCLCSMSTSGYSITSQSIQDELGVSKTLAFLALSSFNVAFGVAPLILAPLSELYGRSTILIVSSVGFAIFLIPQALATNIETLIISRFFYGACGSTGVALGGGILAEVWSDQDRGPSMALFSLSATAPTGLGPVAFGFLSQTKGFRYVNWVLFGMAVLVAIFTYFLLDETRASVLLTRKAKRTRKETGDDRYMSKAEVEKTSLIEMWKTNLRRPVSLLCHEPVLISFTAWIGFTWGVMYLCLVSVPLTYSEVYGFNTGQSGLVYITQTIGSFIGFGIEVYCNRLYRRHEAEKGVEARLFTAFYGGVLFPIGCWIYAFSSYPQVHWIVPSIGLTFLYTGLYLVFVATYSYLADSYALYASSALAAMGFCRNMTGAVFPLFTPAMYENLGIQGAGGLTAGIATILSITPFVLFRYGSRLRARSKFAQELVELRNLDARRGSFATSTIQAVEGDGMIDKV